MPIGIEFDEKEGLTVNNKYHCWHKLIKRHHACNAISFGRITAQNNYYNKYRTDEKGSQLTGIFL